MLRARVEGSIVTSTGHPSLRGWRLLICQVLCEGDRPVGDPIVALDALGAGMHETVILTSDGKSVREKIGDRYSPARYMVMALEDGGHAA